MTTPMTLLNTLLQIKLLDLFGPDSGITDVEWADDCVHFCIPVSQDREFEPVNCQISRVHEGKLECLMLCSELDSQIALRDAIRKYAKDLFNRLDDLA